jgi:DNA invertase Pin-like site-specific DNA recombinase
MIRCAIYTRTNVGNDINHEELHLRQRQAVSAYVAEREKQGWTCVGTYQDVRHSAGHLNRPALKQMLADIASGQIDCVVMESLDRLSRSMDDLYQLASGFQHYGVTLVTVASGPIDMSRCGFLYSGD